MRYRGEAVLENFQKRRRRQRFMVKLLRATSLTIVGGRLGQAVSHSVPKTTTRRRRIIVSEFFRNKVLTALPRRAQTVMSEADVSNCVGKILPEFFDVFDIVF